MEIIVLNFLHLAIARARYMYIKENLGQDIFTRNNFHVRTDSCFEEYYIKNFFQHIDIEI